MSEELKTPPPQPVGPELRTDAGDGAALPPTEAHPAPLLDSGSFTGPATVGWSPSDDGDDGDHRNDGDHEATSAPDATVQDIGSPVAEATALRWRPVSATSVVLPGQYHYVKWWKALLIFAAVWIPAAALGLGLFSLWYSLVDKSPAVFALLVYTVVCTLIAAILAMVPDRPLVSVLALAVASAVFAAGLGAAPLYGYRYCQVQGPCLLKVIPY